MFVNRCIVHSTIWKNRGLHYHPAKFALILEGLPLVEDGGQDVVLGNVVRFVVNIADNSYVDAKIGGLEAVNKALVR